MFDILSILTQHTAFLEDNLKKLDLNQKRSIGSAFAKFYLSLPNATKCIQEHLKIKITKEQLIQDLLNDNVQYFKDAIKKHNDETDPYAADFVELEPIEIFILGGLENCVNCLKKSHVSRSNFLLIIDILDYCENFSDQPEYWNHLLEDEILFQQKIVKQIAAGEILEENLYYERYKEVNFDAV